MLDLLDQQERIARFHEKRDVQEDSPARQQDLVADAWWRLSRGEGLEAEHMAAVLEFLDAKISQHRKRGKVIAEFVQALVDLGISPDGNPSALVIAADRFGVSVNTCRTAWRGYSKKWAKN